MTTVRYATLAAGVQQDGAAFPTAVPAGPSATGRWLRPIAVLAALVFVLALGASWVRVARGATHGYLVYRPSEAPATLIVHLVNLPDSSGASGLAVGDRIVEVEGRSVGDSAAVDAFWRPRQVGDHLDVRVQRVADGRLVDVSLPIYAPLGNVQAITLLFLTSVFAIVWMAVGVTVALARPDEPAARPLLFASVTVALSIPSGIWLNAPDASWDFNIRTAYFLSAAFAVGFLHLFLVFPATHPLLARLRRLGPAPLRAVGGGTFLLYVVPVGVSLALSVGPLVTVAASLLVFLVCTAASVGLLVNGYVRPATPLARPQLQWILLAQAALLIAVVVFSAVILLFEEQPPLSRASFYAVASLTPLAIAFAVLRYRLFDVGLVVRLSVTYALLTALLIGGYLATSFVLSQIAVAFAPSAARSPTASVLAALAVAVVANPLRWRLQATLDRLVYRGRTARRAFLAEAGELLRRARAPEALAAFLTRHTAQRLDLTGAWLALPAGLAGGGPPPAPAEPLLARLSGCTQPTVLSRVDLSASAVPTLSAADPVLEPWYDAGARLLVPLRAAPTAGPGGTGQDTLVGVWVLGALRSGDFPDREGLAAVALVGQQAAVLLDYARLARDQMQQALVAQDLARARDIQRRMLPADHGGWPGLLEIAARLEPARETSGDFYDVFDLVPPEAPGEPGGRGRSGAMPLQIAVGDVQGKGTGAAMVMALAQATLRSTAYQWSAVSAWEEKPADTAGPEPAAPGARGGRSTGPPRPPVPPPHRTLDLTGALLYRSLGATDFVACALAVVEPPDWSPDEAGPRPGPRLRLSNAGQVPPLLCRAGAAIELVPPGDHLPLGIFAHPSYGELVIDLQPGDVVVFASDGLPEAPAARREADPLGADRTGVSGHGLEPGRSPPGPVQGEPESGEFFGFGRLAASAAAWAGRGGSARSLLEGIWADVAAWSGGTSHHDDKTIVVLQVPG
jgi:serine phosphatase RsbU (regulator of sigma subunit)